MDKKSSKKRGCLIGVIVAAVLVIALLIFIMSHAVISDPDSSSESSSQISSAIVESSESEELHESSAVESENDTSESNIELMSKEDIKVAVEALVPAEYQGQSYSCDILEHADGSGYIVSLQIDVDVDPSESTDIVNDFVDQIKALNIAQIVEVNVSAIHDMQLVDFYSSEIP